MKAMVRAITTSGKVKLLTEQGQQITVSTDEYKFIRTGDMVTIKQINQNQLQITPESDTVLPQEFPPIINMPKQEIENVS